MNNLDFDKIIKQLEINNFEVFPAQNIQAAKHIFENKILKYLKISSISYADSITMHKTGILNDLRNIDSIEFIDTFDDDDSRKDQINKRKKALTADLFLTGTNAITEKGQLVNLDMIGNRVAPLAFGPRNVVLFIGKNKIVKNLDEAFNRIRTISAPLNAKRHKNLKTPCQKTGICSDCKRGMLTTLCQYLILILKLYILKYVPNISFCFQLLNTFLIFLFIKKGRSVLRLRQIVYIPFLDEKKKSTFVFEIEEQTNM